MACTESLLLRLFLILGIAYQTFGFGSIVGIERIDEGIKGVFTKNITLKLTVTNQIVVLNLQKNNAINKNVPIYLGNGTDNVMFTDAKDIAYYIDIDHKAAITAKRTPPPSTEFIYEGSFEIDGERYLMTPPETPDRETDIDLTISHVGMDGSEGEAFRMYNIVKMPSGPIVFSESEGIRDLPLPDPYTPPIHPFPGEEESSGKRSKRSIPYLDLHLELAFVIDSSEYRFWLDKSGGNETEAIAKIQEYFGNMMNGISLIYSYLNGYTEGLKISTWLKEYRILQADSDAPWTAAEYIISKGSTDEETTVDGVLVLERFSEYRNSIITWSWNNPDIAILWTRYDVSNGGNANTVGLANLCGVCQPERGTLLQENFGYEAFVSAAHEIGHSLGAVHDGPSYNCPANEYYLMTSTMFGPAQLDDEALRNRYHFSKCSLERINYCITGVLDGYPKTCLMNKVCSSVEEVSQTEYTYNEQCQYYYGETAQFCDQLAVSKNTICAVLPCSLPPHDLNSCRANNQKIPLEGTTCSEDGEPKKVCHSGMCVLATTVTYSGEIDPSCEESPAEYPVPDECFEQDFEIGGKKCSELINAVTCTIDVIKYPCCYFCVDAGFLPSDTVCQEDFGYPTCEAHIQAYPHACFDPDSQVSTYCCAKCHRQGLSDLSYDELPTTTEYYPTTNIMGSTEPSLPSVPSTVTTSSNSLLTSSRMQNAQTAAKSTTDKDFSSTDLTFPRTLSAVFTSNIETTIISGSSERSLTEPTTRQTTISSQDRHSFTDTLSPSNSITEYSSNGNTIKTTTFTNNSKGDMMMESTKVSIMSTQISTSAQQRDITATNSYTTSRNSRITTVTTEETTALQTPVPQEELLGTWEMVAIGAAAFVVAFAILVGCGIFISKSLRAPVKPGIASPGPRDPASPYPQLQPFEKPYAVRGNQFTNNTYSYQPLGRSSAPYIQKEAPTGWRTSPQDGYTRQQPYPGHSDRFLSQFEFRPSYNYPQYQQRSNVWLDPRLNFYRQQARQEAYQMPYYSYNY